MRENLQKLFKAKNPLNVLLLDLIFQKHSGKYHQTIAKKNKKFKISLEWLKKSASSNSEFLIEHLWPRPPKSPFSLSH